MDVNWVETYWASKGGLVVPNIVLYYYILTFVPGMLALDIEYSFFGIAQNSFKIKVLLPAMFFFFWGGGKRVRAFSY